MATTAHPSFADGPSLHHHGQQAAQTRVGVRQVMESRGRLVIRKHMNEQAKDFFSTLPFVFVGCRNPDGLVWATTLCGEPGFMQPVDDYHLEVDVRQMQGDPARFRIGTALGLVGVMLHNRRRNKLFGELESLAAGLLRLKITKSIGNCPKYIQIRHVELEPSRLAALGTVERPVERGGASLGEEQLAFIAKSDTCWLATHYAGRPDAKGADAEDFCSVNHRGGAPGFVKAIDSGALLIPDYVGNNFFQSLGNIVASPGAGLQFIDFSTGDSLQLTGQAEVLFDDRSLPGAQRAVSFIVSAWVHVKGGLPFSTTGPAEPSPYNPSLEPTGAVGGGSRLTCVARRSETPDITTFSFRVPAARQDKADQPFCEAGQFASFDFPGLGDGGATLNRTWTISSSPEEVANTGIFTISVKKAGLVSSWLHDNMERGREILFRGVDGDFTLDKAANCIPAAGILLIAGGIGITPMRVMFAEALRRRWPVTLLYSVAEAADMQATKQVSSAKVAVALTASNQTLPGVPVFHGRLTANMIQQACPDVTAREVFQCGPASMMSSAAAALESLGVPATSVHQENFTF